MKTQKSHSKRTKQAASRPGRAGGLKGTAKKAHKSTTSTVLDLVERGAGMLPGAIRGIRGLINMKSQAQEAVFATPASFAVIQNNVNQMAPESPITHSTKGVAGIRLHGVQPFADIRTFPAGDPDYGPIAFLKCLDPASQRDMFHSCLNPLYMSGSLAQQALLYDNYVFRMINFRYVTTQTTTFVGTLGMSVERDAGTEAVGSFLDLRQVIPSVTYPVRVPEARLIYEYDGPDLFFCRPTSSLSFPEGPEARQDFQSTFSLFGAGEMVPDTQLGYLDIEYVIEFYNKVPPGKFAPKTIKEFSAVEKMLEALRVKPQISRLPPHPDFSYYSLEPIHPSVLARDLDDPNEEAAAAASPPETSYYVCGRKPIEASEPTPPPVKGSVSVEERALAFVDGYSHGGRFNSAQVCGLKAVVLDHLFWAMDFVEWKARFERVGLNETDAQLCFGMLSHLRAEGAGDPKQG